MTTWSKFIDSLNENRVLVASVAGVAAALMYCPVAMQLIPGARQGQRISR